MINKVILIGNLGNDPEVRYTADDKAIANINVATTEVWRDRDGGGKQERTEWHRVVFFGRLAEIVAEYLKKGSKVYVEGRLQTRKWQDRDGNDRYTTEVVAREMKMLDGRGGGQAHTMPPVAPPNAAAEKPAAPVSDGGGGAGGDDFDDDIPF